MSRMMKITLIAVISVMALGLAFGAGTIASTKIASAQTAVTGQFNGRGGPGGPGGRGLPGGLAGENQDQYLADALGISLEDLQAAFTSAQDAALAQAVEQGLLTQTQADAIKARSAAGDGRGFGRGFERGFGGPNGTIDMDALLADALKISVDELNAARTQAHDAALAAAVANGDLTQEQADQMQAMQALRAYIDREALSAQALGMSVDELQAARQSGKTMADLLDEKGMTQAEYEAALQAAHEAAVAQAVSDGAITQEQADSLLANPFPMGGRGRGGFDGPKGGPMGGPRGDCPPSSGAPSTTPTDGATGNGA